MAANAFFNGVTPALWYSYILYNQLFNAKISPTSGLPSQTPVKASAATEATTSKIDALNGLYRRQYDLLAEAETLSTINESDSVFFRQTASTSDSAVADIAYFNPNNYYGEVPDSEIEIDVAKLAQEQINLGANDFNPDDATTITNGSTIKITVDGQDYTYTLGVQAGDTWDTTLEKLRQGINDLDIGIMAEIVPLGTGNVQFQLTGQQGAANGFSVSDQSGDIVSTLDIGTATQTADDAMFTVDGQLYRQANNAAFILDGKMELELTGVGTATITIEPDSSGVVSAVEDVLDAMNQMTSFLASNQYLSSTLSTRWSRLVDRAAFLLGNYGVESDINGALSLTSTALTSALEQDWSGVADAFGGQGGLVQNLKSFSEYITGSPGAWLLSTPPQSGYGSLYLRSLSSAPRFRVGASSFWQVA